MIPKKVKIVEVGPRDGLQNEPQLVPLAVKIELIERLGMSGLRYIEAASFVSPKWVPQMADSADVMAGIKRRKGVVYSALTPNMRGFESALAAGVDEVAIFAAASESFSQRNINCSIAESLDRFGAVCEAALAANIPVRGYVSCVLGCPYEGEIAVSAVADVTDRLFRLGCHEVSLGDTIGRGTPGKAREMIAAVEAVASVERLGVHFHDTYGQALANIYAVMDLGIATIDSAVSGLGGCPYANGATGNVATEDVVYMLDGLGIDSGVDLRKLVAAGAFIADGLDRASASKVNRALSG